MAERAESARPLRLREGMMNRIGWFTHLRLAFERTVKQHGVPELVVKADFLRELAGIQEVRGR